jgi:hypothetical protein
MDFRFEGGYTDLPGLIQFPPGGFYYWNVGYLDGHTNKGNIMGNATMGRQGIAFRATSTYWFASDKTIQFGYRNQEADKDFLGGGNLKDIYLRSEWTFGRGVSLSSFLQHERWVWPLLSPAKQNNFSVSFQLTYWPHWRLTSGK